MHIRLKIAFGNSYAYHIIASGLSFEMIDAKLQEFYLPQIDSSLVVFSTNSRVGGYTY